MSSNSEESPFAPPDSDCTPPTYKPKIPAGLILKMAFRHAASKTKKWGGTVCLLSGSAQLINLFSVNNSVASIIFTSTTALAISTILQCPFPDPVTTQKFRALEDEAREHLEPSGFS